jgi:hypothetical protein
MRSIAGGDPRVVSDDHNPYGVIILVEDSPRGGRKLGALLYDLKRRRAVPIELKGDGFQLRFSEAAPDAHHNRPSQLGDR